MYIELDDYATNRVMNNFDCLLYTSDAADDGVMV